MHGHIHIYNHAVTHVDLRGYIHGYMCEQPNPMDLCIDTVMDISMDITLHASKNISMHVSRNLSQNFFGVYMTDGYIHAYIHGHIPAIHEEMHRSDAPSIYPCVNIGNCSYSKLSFSAITTRHVVFKAAYVKQGLGSLSSI